jgi:hypothetical protein
VLLLGGSSAAAYAAQVAATCAAILFVGWIWWRKLSLEVRAAALVAATLIAVPLAIFYDLMLAAIAGAWLCRRSQSIPPWQSLLFAVSYLVLLNSQQIAEAARVPVGLLIVAALVATVIHRAVREARIARGPIAS